MTDAVACHFAGVRVRSTVEIPELVRAVPGIASGDITVHWVDHVAPVGTPLRSGRSSEDSRPMADTPVTHNPAAPPPSGRRPWTAPRRLEYGHIGKLTQGNSGTKVEPSGGKRIV